MEKTVIKVEGMSCGHCVKAVEGALNELDGVLSAKVDLEAANVTVEYDSAKLGLDAMKEAIEDQGYDVID
ncbi:MAG TPA: copper chaperone CopZ [Clostridiales bacterium]|jgi:copper chaperone|nr:copper chaperone CopZ [Clostridiales bacterium]